MIKSKTTWTIFGSSAGAITMVTAALDFLYTIYPDIPISQEKLSDAIIAVLIPVIARAIAVYRGKVK